jgi:rSAM/selenodomain-associated transferase 1
LILKTIQTDTVFSAMSTIDKRLIIFLKAPRPGLVKTRLAKTMGMEAACAAYGKMVTTLLANVSSLSGVQLRFAPDDAEGEIQPWLKAGWQSQAQGEGGLGQRLCRAFADAHSAGAKRVVIIGSDCPEVNAADIREAWAELKHNDVVVGPATDGGYWLIGLRQPQPQLFQGIRWSSETVLAETLERARSSHLRIQVLRILADVDTEKDWLEFLASSGRQ